MSIYLPKNLKDFSLGKVVTLSDSHIAANSIMPRSMIGHVVGFGLNSQNELTIRVIDQYENAVEFHPNNLKIL